MIDFQKIAQDGIDAANLGFKFGVTELGSGGEVTHYGCETPEAAIALARILSTASIAKSEHVAMVSLPILLKLITMIFLDFSAASEIVMTARDLVRSEDTIREHIKRSAGAGSKDPGPSSQ